MVASVICFSIMDICVKWLDYYPVGQVLFLRFFIGFVPIFFIIPRNKFLSFYKTTRPGLHAFRAISGALAIIALFYGLRELPLADVVSLTFGGPIFVTIASIFFLSEKVGFYRWLAVLLGFIGIIIITEPGFGSLNIYYIYPIIFCLGLSYVAIAIRQLSSTEPVWLISLNFSLAITLASLFTIPFGWVMPDVKDLLLLCMIGFLGGFANLWLGQSFKLSEVSLVSPLKYLALVFGIIFGYFIWDEIPTIKTLLGALLVVFSSLIILRREIYHKEKIPSTTRHE